MRLGRTFTMGAALLVGSFLAAGAPLAGDKEGKKCTLSASAEKCCQNLAEKLQKRGWLGVEKDLNEDGTFTITSVVPGSPAERAGLQAGDVIESIDGAVLAKGTGEKICSEKADKAKIGDTVSYGVRRGQERLTVSAELARIPDAVLAELKEKHKAEHAVAHN